MGGRKEGRERRKEGKKQGIEGREGRKEGMKK